MYRIRLRDKSSDIYVIDVTFSQLCEHYLPPGRLGTDFWNGKTSADGPMGNVKIVEGM